MSEKKWFYVTIKRTEVWNVSVEAEDETEAKDLADSQWNAFISEPDYTDWDYEAEEVTKHVE